MATAYRFVNTLRERGLLERDTRSGHYTLGLKLLELEGLIHRKLDLESLSIPLLKKLAAKSGETVQLTVVNADRGICTFVEESPAALRLAPEKGRVLPLHAGASVQVILAFLREEDQKRICRGRLEPFTPQTITHPKELERRLTKIRKQGVAMTFGELYLGSVGIASPIFDRNHRAVASVAVSGPTQRMTAERREVIREEVVRVAKRISETLGCRFDHPTHGES